jgi:putative SOS response-associated peptidase YedK
MCGRFTLTSPDLGALARAWAAEADAALLARWRPRFNVAPGDPHPVLVAAGGVRRLAPARFGLAGARGALLLNARIETAAGKPTFREAWRGRRAAVPADGFFEWDGPAGDRRPHWFHRDGGAPLLFAALLGVAPGGGTGFAILTTAADEAVSALHDRMPVIVPARLLAAWLEGPPPALPALQAPLARRPVSRRVNAVEHDDPGCLAPQEPPRQGSLL